MEGRRRGRGVTHIAEPGVFIEENVLIGKPLGEQQHCTGTLLLVLHLGNLPFSLSFAFSCHLVLLSSFTSQNVSSLRLHRSLCCLSLPPFCISDFLCILQLLPLTPSPLLSFTTFTLLSLVSHLQLFATLCLRPLQLLIPASVFCPPSSSCPHWPRLLSPIPIFPLSLSF